MLTKYTRSNYDAAFKLKVIDFVKVNVNCITGKHYEKLRQQNEPRHYTVSPSLVFKKDLFEWVSEIRQNEYNVIRCAIRVKGLSLANWQKINLPI